MSEHIYEAAVIGAGPIGLEMAIALKRAGIDYIHFDAKQIGHTISWFAPQTRFFSSNERIAIAGVPLFTPDQSKATREQYLTYLRTVVEQFDLQIHTYEPVVNLEHKESIFSLTTRPAGAERTWRAQRVILVTGGTDRPRRIGCPGEDLPHVSHYFGDPHDYFRRRVLIVGGKNSAVEAALRCHHVGAQVTLSYRRSQLPQEHIKYWLVPEINGLIRSGRMSAYLGSTVKRITAADVSLALDDGSEKTLPFDVVLLLTGYEQDNALLKCAGIELCGECDVPTFNPQTMETKIPNLYVAGTAIGGTQEKYTVFIENCHEHVEKILRHAFGREADLHPVEVDAPES